MLINARGDGPAVASAQCADPRGNSYCAGPVVFPTAAPAPPPAPQPIRPPQPEPQPQPRPTAASPQITLDADSAAVGGTLTVSGIGFALGGSGTDLFLNLEPAPTGGNLRTALGSEMRRNDPSVIRSGDNGTFFVQVAVPDAQPGLQQICACRRRTAWATSFAHRFTVLDGGTPATSGLAPFHDPSAPINPVAIIGR